MNFLKFNLVSIGEKRHKKYLLSRMKLRDSFIGDKC